MDLHDLYLKDETAWIDRTAEQIGRGAYSEIDYEGLRELLESMANRDRRRVEGRIKRLIEPILKWEHQPGRRGNSWRRTIVEQQQSLADDVSAGSLRRHAVEVLPEAYRKAAVLASAATGLPEDAFPPVCPWSLDELLAYKPRDSAPLR